MDTLELIDGVVEERCPVSRGPQSAPEILDEARMLIGDRASERDQADGERSMARCVKSFNAMTGQDLSVEQGWLFMVFLKFARMQGGKFKLDDYLDAASYCGLMAEEAIKENTA